MNRECDETRLSRSLSWLLLAGLALAVTLMLTGAVLASLRTGRPVARESSLTELPRALAALEPEGFLDLGLLVLLATPIAKTAALLVGFARRRAWLFSVISLAVLVMLALSALLGVRAD
ncbi:MAG: DUF1634 domain-containing protein [Actinomycetia bacterium]|nr:DUF1634 domain-containing protein [Actinomycetes bacterium]